MNVADLSVRELERRLRHGRLRLCFGPFTVGLTSNLPDMAPLLARVYAPYSLGNDEFADFHIRLVRARGLRRWWRPQVHFSTDCETPFQPFPQDTALPLLEWGLNWLIATRAHQFLMLHSAVVERDGVALLLPAWPGSGKSTLCAALAHRGWRLLSDEFGLIRCDDLSVVPLPRLVPLKNQSIDVIRRFAPEAFLGPVYPKTRKGDVSHLRPPRESIERAGEPARAGWIVFPEFKAGASLRLLDLPKGRAFVKLSHNAFNYETCGLRGFETVAGLIDHCHCRLLRYGSLDEAVDLLGELVAGGEPVLGEQTPGEGTGLSAG